MIGPPPAVLVQTNFGGAPVGRELGRWYLKDELEPKDQKGAAPGDPADGSVIVVIATDEPLEARNLRRLAARSMLGLGRTGSAASHGSGDYAIAFSTAPAVRIPAADKTGAGVKPRAVKLLHNEGMSPLFEAVIEATEEAVYNSLFRATTVTGQGRTVDALPLDRTRDILRKHGVIPVAPPR